MNTIVYRRVVSDDELFEIIKLQKRNITASISIEEQLNEGFVTVQHDLETLKMMNDACAHVIAIHNNTIVGYALSMLDSFKNTIAVLKPMFKEIETCISPNVSYIIMGQICVDKNYRKQGVFKGLYNFMKSELNTVFDIIITEVDIKNTRSLNAHYAIGFNLLKRYTCTNQEWALLFWKW
ncbi:GNAT family N-acetyltransferase [Algibacter aquimarinus]|uniref:N-acetyltransferase domain-containing protein n=1 Tax=Algibacter aquimarinus TaxID=1136748 RepID=A0ABP9HBI5_9FLAO